jgi:1,4-dihydroxy-2-naphthoyl-CoA hydrolase
MRRLSPAELDAFCRDTMVEQLGIHFVEQGDDYISASMPVDARTVQPARLLHGGASVALIETLASVGAYLCLDPNHQHCVGIEVNANHLRPVASGEVTGVARPLHVGQRTHVWEVRITDTDGRLVCVGRLTLAVVAAPASAQQP